MNKTLRIGDLAVAALVLAVVAMMIVPVPRPLLDGLLALNLALTVVLLMASVFVTTPTRFAVFPTMLVLSTLFRVGLNVSTTRLILADADGGQVIHAFGSAVVASNLVVGLVVFAVITIVQLVVVARGAERVAEVAARFALDAMPGQQQAIDADVRAGLLDANTARARRSELTRESQLYGAMDGAMRFVKGDAIAAIIIVLVNLVGGLIIGIGYHHLAPADAVRTYSLLSVGEGLVAQIPALLLAVASGLLVTRAASVGEGDHGLGLAISDQVFGQPRTLMGAAVLMAALALVPALPLVPFAVLAVGLAALALWRRRQVVPSAVEAQPSARVVEVVGGSALSLTAEQAKGWRDAVNDKLGISCPEVRIGVGTATLGPRELEVRLYGAPLTWLTVVGNEIDATVIRALTSIAHEFVTIDDVAAMVNRTAQIQPITVREIVPRVITLASLTELIRALVREQVPVGDLGAILEAVAQQPKDADSDALLDHVRGQLRRQISGRWAPRGQLEVYTLDGMIEDAVRSAIDRRAGTAILALEPDIARDIVAAVRSKVGNDPAVVLTSGDLRRHVRTLLAAELPECAVLAPHELAPGVAVRAAARIEV